MSVKVFNHELPFLRQSKKWLDALYLPICKLSSWGAICFTLVLTIFSFASNEPAPIETLLSPISLGSTTSAKIHNPAEAFNMVAKNHLKTLGSELKLGKTWIYVETKACKSGCTVQLPNIRSLNSKFWSISNNSFLPLGFTESADGISIHAPPAISSPLVIGVIERQTLYPINAIQRESTPAKSSLSVSEKDKFGGLLFGAIFSLAIFTLLVSLLNRDISFLILSGWLLTTCRLAAFNGPWDFYWMGIGIAPETQIVFQKISLAIHTVLSVALFLEMIREHLSQSRERLIAAVFLIAVSTMPFSLAASTEVYFLYFWIVSGCTLLLLQAIALQIAFQKRLLHLTLFNLALFTIFAGCIVDILFMAGYSTSKLKLLNLQTGAVASAIIMSLAIADKMRRERNSRLATQNSLLSVFKKFKSLYSNVPVGLGTFNDKLELVAHNELFRRTLGLSTESSLKGKSLNFLFPEAVALFESAIKQQGSEKFECTLNVAGNLVWLRVNTRKVGSTIDCTFEDITARKLSEEKLEFLARHDPLTGFKNRHEFDKTLQALLDDKSKLTRTSVAHIDIKGFKLFNELFGHALGDEMLTQFADRIESANKRGHQVFRLDGDDFYVIFADMDGPTVEFECSIIQDALSRRHYVVNQRAMALEVGIGIVHLNDGISANDVLASASDASDKAKRSSETKVIAVSRDSEALKEQIQERHLMASMKQRFPEERLFLNAQPIISLADPNGSLAYEVLVRLKGENGGVISPGQFIPAAEKNGLMSMVDRWVLNETLVWLELNKEHAKRVDFITVNLSGASLNDLHFAEDALAIIKEHRQLASKICFEVTESVALFDLKATLRFVEQTKSFGCKLALDDFGAGYTSFKYLKDIPSDILKIDGSYVRGINKSVANHAIVKAITDLTHEMGMKCVAEWIEDIPTIRTLQRLGMDYGQGFGMSRPMPMDEITAATSGFDAMTEPAAIDFYSKLLHLPHRRMQAASEQTDEASSRILLPVA
jgi:diguanylate cyclase (GGDEF)-like protein/PAS domain S-box-containing protein